MLPSGDNPDCLTFVNQSLFLKKKKKNENFKRWISWFPYRWRTQRTAISNANCRIRESFDFWTQHALWRNSLKYISLSIADYNKTKCDWTCKGSLIKLECEAFQSNEVVTSSFLRNDSGFIVLLNCLSIDLLVFNHNLDLSWDKSTRRT